MSGRGISVLQLYHAWINSILNEEELHIASLSELQDGTVLYRLLDILYPNSKDDQKFQASREKVAIQRVQGVLDLLYRNGVKVAVGAHEILQGDTKALLDVLWGIILNFFIHTPERPPTQRTVRVAKRNLLDWCKQQQPDLAFNIHASLGKNFGKSDVLARIICTNCQVEDSEELIEYLANAVTATEDQLGINKDILNPVDIIDGTIDEHALLVYLALIKRKSQLRGQSNGNTPILPNGHPDDTTSPVLLNTNNQRRSPSPKAASPRNNTWNPEPCPVSPRQQSKSPNELCEIPQQKSLLSQVELEIDDDEPITFEVPSSSTPRSPLISPRRSPIHSPYRSLSPAKNADSDLLYPPTNNNVNPNFDLVIDLTDGVDSLAPNQNSPSVLPRKLVPDSSPVGSPRRAASPQRTQSPSLLTTESTSPRRSQSTSPERTLTTSLLTTESTSPRRSQSTSPQRTQSTSPERPLSTSLLTTESTSPRRSQSTSPQRTQSTSPERTQTTSPQRTQSPSPQRTQSPSPQRTQSPYQPLSPPSARRTPSPQTVNVNHVYSPRNTPSIEQENLRSPLGSPDTPRRQKALSPLGSPRAQSPRVTSPHINGYRGMNGVSNMDPSERLDLNGLDEKGAGNQSDGEPNSARSARTDTSDWLSSSSGSVHAYNFEKCKDDIIDSGVDTELAEAIKNKVSEHFEVNSEQNTPRFEENIADVTLTEKTVPSGMCKSMSNDDLLTMLEAIGHQGKTLRDELISREQELMLMQATSDDPALGIGLVEKYEKDVEILKRENELLSKEVASAKSASLPLPEQEIVNTLLSEIGQMREKMDAVETSALSPRDDMSPRLDLDSGFKESVQRLSYSMDNLDQKLGMINKGSAYSSMDSLQDRGSLFTKNPETKPPSGAFKNAELRWHDQEKALKEQISAQRRKINELESMVTLTQNDNKDLQRKLDKASTNITNRVNEMDAMINETRKEMEALQVDNDELQENRKNNKQELNKLEEEIVLFEKRIGSLQRENSGLTDQLQAYMKKSQASEGTPSRLEALTKENTTMKEKLAASEEEKKQLQLDVMKYIKRCREAEGKENKDPSPQKSSPAQKTTTPSRSESPSKQNSSVSGSRVKQNTPALGNSVKQNGDTRSSPKKSNTATEPRGYNGQQTKPAYVKSPVKTENNSSSSVLVTSSLKRNPPKQDDLRKNMTENNSSPSVSVTSSPKRSPSKQDDPRKSSSSPTKYITETPERNAPVYSREEQGSNLNPSNKYQHHERIMLQAKQAMQEVEYNPEVLKEKPINLAELSRKYPELDRYSNTPSPEERGRVNTEKENFDDVVERVSVVSKTLDSELEKSWDLYQKMKTPNVTPISRARLRSDESARSSERGSEPHRTSNGERRLHDSDHRFTPPPRRTHDERPESSKLGHRRTHSTSGEKPEQFAAVEEPGHYRPRQYGSLQNLLSKERTSQGDAVDSRNQSSYANSVPSSRPVYRTSSADRLANRQAPDRSRQVETAPSRSPPQEHEAHTPDRSSDIRSILQKRFGSAPLPPRMSAAMRIRKQDESGTPTRPMGHYSDSRPTGSRGAPVKVIHTSNEPVYQVGQSQYQPTPKPAWDDENDQRLRGRNRGEEMPRRRMYQDEEESRAHRSEERKPAVRRHGSGPRYQDRTPSRESDRYGGQEQFESRDPRQTTAQPPMIMVTPPDDQGAVTRPRQLRRFSGSGPDTDTQRAEETQSPVYSRERDSRPPSSSSHRSSERRQTNRVPERQQTTHRSQTPQRSPVKQNQDSLRERHPSSPSKLRGEEDPNSNQQDMYETGQLVNWRDVARDYGVNVNDNDNDDYPYFGVSNNAPSGKQTNVLQYKDYDNPNGEPVVASCEADNMMDTNGIYHNVPEPSQQKMVHKPSHRRAQSLDNRNRSGSPQNQNSYVQINGDSGARNVPPPSSPLKGNPQLRDSPTHRSASSISQISNVSRTEPEPETPVYNNNDGVPPKLSAAQIAYVDSLIQKYTST